MLYSREIAVGLALLLGGFAIAEPYAAAQEKSDAKAAAKGETPSADAKAVPKTKGFF